MPSSPDGSKALTHDVVDDDRTHICYKPNTNCRAESAGCNKRSTTKTQSGRANAPTRYKQRRKQTKPQLSILANKTAKDKAASTVGSASSHNKRLPTRNPTSDIAPRHAIMPANDTNMAMSRQKTRRNSTGKKRGAASSVRGTLYAALDLGTSSCRLLIAAPTQPGYFRVIDAFSRVVRLGEGLSRTGMLSHAAMDRTIEALKICQAKLGQQNIRYQRLIATEACRSAANGSDFIQRVQHETGLKLEVIGREAEARLAVSGCNTLVEKETDAIVLFDIGGGSSEIALLDISKQRLPRLSEHITAWTSLPVGVVTLAEKFGGKSVTMASFHAMKAYVKSFLGRFVDRNKLGQLVGSHHFHLVGTSGTVTTLAGIYLKLERYDRKRIDGVWMRSRDIKKVIRCLLSWDLNKRIANPCIGQDRADLVLAGCAILEAILDMWPSQKLRVADRGVREGILTELMLRHGAWHHARKRRHKAGALYG